MLIFCRGLLQPRPLFNLSCFTIRLASYLVQIPDAYLISCLSQSTRVSLQLVHVFQSLGRSPCSYSKEIPSLDGSPKQAKSFGCASCKDTNMHIGCLDWDSALSTGLLQQLDILFGDLGRVSLPHS